MLLAHPRQQPTSCSGRRPGPSNSVTADLTRRADRSFPAYKATMNGGKRWFVNSAPLGERDDKKNSFYTVSIAGDLSAVPLRKKPRKATSLQPDPPGAAGTSRPSSPSASVANPAPVRLHRPAAPWHDTARGHDRRLQLYPCISNISSPDARSAKRPRATSSPGISQNNFQSSCTGSLVLKICYTRHR